jgi:sarcosine oxidase
MNDAGRCRFLHRTGVLWMVSSRDDAYERGSLAMLGEARIKFQELSTTRDEEALAADQLRMSTGESSNPSADISTPAPVARQWSMLSSPARRRIPAGRGLAWGLERCASSQLESIRRLAAQGRLTMSSPAARGWASCFPKRLATLIRPTKQDIFSSAARRRFALHRRASSRVGRSRGKRFFYGIPGSDRRGFKIADDTRGPAFDPTNGERVISPATLKARSRISSLSASRR